MDWEQKFEEYKRRWAKKTEKQIQKELDSWHRHMNKHDRAYAFHGGNLSRPDSLADGDRVLALKEVLREKQAAGVGA